MRQVRVLDVLIFATLMTLSTPILVWAHGTAGKRFFPTTLTIEDPFVSDELSFLFGYIKEPGAVVDSQTTVMQICGDHSIRI